MTVDIEQPPLDGVTSFAGEEPNKPTVHPLQVKEFINGKNAFIQISILIILMYFTELISYLSVILDGEIFWYYSILWWVPQWILFTVISSVFIISALFCIYAIYGVKNNSLCALNLFWYYNVFAMIYNGFFVITPLSYLAFLKIAMHSRLYGYCKSLSTTIKNWNKQSIEISAAVSAIHNVELQNITVQKDVILTQKLSIMESACFGKTDARNGTLYSSICVILISITQIGVFNFCNSANTIPFLTTLLNPVFIVGIVCGLIGYYGARKNLRPPSSGFYAYCVVALIGDLIWALVTIIAFGSSPEIWLARFIIIIIDLPLRLLFVMTTSKYDKILNAWEEEEKFMLAKLEPIEL